MISVDQGQNSASDQGQHYSPLNYTEIQKIVKHPILYLMYESNLQIGRLERWENTVDSRYLEFQGTLWNTSRYPYLEISDLHKWGKQ